MGSNPTGGLGSSWRVPRGHHCPTRETYSPPTCARRGACGQSLLNPDSSRAPPHLPPPPLRSGRRIYTLARPSASSDRIQRGARPPLLQEARAEDTRRRWQCRGGRGRHGFARTQTREHPPPALTGSTRRRRPGATLGSRVASEANGQVGRRWARQLAMASTAHGHHHRAATCSCARKFMLVWLQLCTHI